MKQVRAYYCPDGMQRFPKELRSVIEYSSDNMVLVMFRDGWTQWVNQRLIEVETA
jgi:hypothetical protein